MNFRNTTSWHYLDKIINEAVKDDDFTAQLVVKAIVDYLLKQRPFQGYAKHLLEYGLIVEDSVEDGQEHNQPPGPYNGCLTKAARTEAIARIKQLRAADDGIDFDPQQVSNER